MTRRAALLLLALSVAARAAEREGGSLPVVPSLPAGLGQANAPLAPALPSSSLSLPSLPATAIPQGTAAPSAASAAAPSALTQAKSGSAPAAQAQGRAVGAGDSLLERSGVPADAARALGAFAADESLFPNGDRPAFHDGALARRLMEFAAEQPASSARDRTLLAAAALLATLDPARAPGTLPTPSGNSDFLAEDPRARRLAATLEALRFPGEAPITAAELRALVRGSDPSLKLAEGSPDPALARTLEQARRLQFLRRAAPFLGETIDAQNRLPRLAAERRATASAALGRRVDAPSDAQVTGSAFTEADALRRSPYYASLPASARDRFETTLTVLQLFRTDAPSAEERRAAARPPARAGPQGTIALLDDGRSREVTVSFDKAPSGMEATFMVTDASGRKLALKTARYVGVASRKDERAAVTREADMTRAAQRIAATPGFPANVKVPRFLGLADLPPALSKAVYGEAATTPGLLLARAPGRTLQDHMMSGGRLNARDFAGLLEAYKLFHAAGFVHGDPNPGNILISEENGRQSFTILDFGAAKLRAQLDAAKWDSYRESELESVQELAVFFRDAGRLVGGR